MELPAEAIDKIQALVIKGLTPVVIKPEAEPDDVYYISDPNSGKMERHIAEHKLIGTYHISTESLIELAESHKKAGCTVSFFASEDEISILSKDPSNGRIGRHYMQLLRNEQLMVLERWYEKSKAHNPEYYKPRDLWNILRTTFHDSMAKELISIFSRVKITNNEAGEANFKVGEEQLNRSVRARIEGTDAYPDEVIFNIGIYAVPEVESLRYCVRVALDTRAQCGDIGLIPLEGELRIAKASALQNITNNIRLYCEKEGVPLYWGAFCR